MKILSILLPVMQRNLRDLFFQRIIGSTQHLHTHRMLQFKATTWMSYEIACVTMLVSYEPLKQPEISTFLTMCIHTMGCEVLHGSCTACSIYALGHSCQDIFCRCFLLHMCGHFTVFTNFNSALRRRGVETNIFKAFSLHSNKGVY